MCTTTPFPLGVLSARPIDFLVKLRSSFVKKCKEAIRIALFVTQGLDRIQAGSFDGWI